MMSSARNTKRFLGPPKKLTPETGALGFTAAQWHEKITGGMAEELARVRRLVEQLKDQPPPTMPTKSQDVGSWYGEMMRKRQSEKS